MNLLKPNPLRPGDAIGVVAPAGPVDRQRIDRAFRRIRERGFRIKTYAGIYRKTGYLAGDDATRADELMAAFADPETAAVWCARGGYGVVRILDRLDYNLVRRHPKVFIGFSDITALHLAFHEKAGLVTFHGPNLQDGFGKEAAMPPPTEAALWQAILADRQSDSPAAYDDHIAATQEANLQTLAPGIAAGPLTGGNLAVLCGLMGTPFEINTAGRILFIEDVSERLYRIDRYLAQLTLAGKLQSAAAILVGNFSYDEGEDAEPEDQLAALLHHYLAGLKIPVLTGFPAGHAKYNLTLSLGATHELNANTPTLTRLDTPVSTDH